jgi:molecular chaperone GrpE
MTEKEKKSSSQEIPEEVTEVPVEPADSLENGEQQTDFEKAQEEIAVMKEQLEEAEAKAAENLDGWQRSQAEFINYKKRIERDRALEYNSMKGDVIRKLLPVLDDLERALANRPQDESWSNGIELIARKFQSVLESDGIKRIEAQGEFFDPNFHEAISNEPSDEVESGRVIEVVQNGYMLGDRVIRPAVVRVAQ